MLMRPAPSMMPVGLNWIEDNVSGTPAWLIPPDPGRSISAARAGGRNGFERKIVNAYCAMGRTNEAKTANERAKWLLRRMPPDAFKSGGFTMPKEYWDKWLQWTASAGLW